MRTLFSFLFGLLIVLFMIAAPLAYQRQKSREFRNFRVVESGVLYRSGQLSVPRLRQIVSQYGIKTIISLRDGESDRDQAEEEWTHVRGFRFERIPYRSWAPDATGEVPAEIGIKEFRAVMDDPANYPVLVHCFAGIHRTGAMCAVFRMDYQGWTNAQALAEMRLMGYTMLDDHQDVRDFLTAYRPPHAAKKVLAIPTGRRLVAHP